jgi:hypothetical protein
MSNKFNLKFDVFLNGKKAGVFDVSNMFDNINVDLFLHKDMDGEIRINGVSKFFPRDYFAKESGFYMPARKNNNIDSKYQIADPKTLLTGSSLVSGHMAYDSQIRINYEEEIKKMILEVERGNISTSTYATLRYQAQMGTKRQLSVIGQNLSEFPPFGKSSADQKATMEAIKSGKKILNNDSFRTRKLTNTTAKVVRGVGAGVVVISVAQSVFRVVKAEDKGQAAVKEGVGWGASIAGGEIGMQAGAEIGGAIGICFGGVGYAPGAAIGGFIGGIAGGIGGYIWGMDAMNKFYRHGEQVEFKGYGGGSTGGAGAGGRW